MHCPIVVSAGITPVQILTRFHIFRTLCFFHVFIFFFFFLYEFLQRKHVATWFALALWVGVRGCWNGRSVTDAEIFLWGGRFSGLILSMYITTTMNGFSDGNLS